MQMATLKRRVANPMPAFLVSVNPKKRGAKMATRRRRRTRRRVHRAAANPIRRRRTTVHRRRRRSVFASRRRRSNPVVHHRRRRAHRRRRNPVATRANFSQAVNLSVGAIGVGFVTPLLSKYVGSYLPFGQYNGPVLTFGSGWVTSKLFGLTNFTRRFADAAFLAGTAAAVIQLVSPIIRSVLGVSLPANPLMSGPYHHRGMVRGIAAVPTNQPPGMAIPLPPPAASGGMQGIGAYPTVGSFRR